MEVGHRFDPHNIDKFEWHESPLVKNLEDKYYEKLIFTIQAHGNKSLGASIFWKSLLLLKSF